MYAGVNQGFLLNTSSYLASIHGVSIDYICLKYKEVTGTFLPSLLSFMRTFLITISASCTILKLGEISCLIHGRLSYASFPPSDKSVLLCCLYTLVNCHDCPLSALCTATTKCRAIIEGEIDRFADILSSHTT